MHRVVTITIIFLNIYFVSCHKQNSTPIFSLELAAPADYRVFQRNVQNVGDVAVSLIIGDFEPAFFTATLSHHERAKIIHRSRFDMTMSVRNHTVELNLLSVPQGGWYRLQIDAYDSSEKLIARGEKERIGVGDVFLVAGQSNSTNCATERLKPQSDLVATTDGQVWRHGEDPQIGAHDFAYGLCVNGSYWPVVGDYLVQKLGVPVAFAVTGYGGTQVEHWLSAYEGKDLFSHTLNRAKQLGVNGFRAILWHQGESDALNGVSEETYYVKMKTLISRMRERSGWKMPWLVAHATWCGGEAGARGDVYPPVRAAQARLVQHQDFIFAGPDTDQFLFAYRSEPRGDCHFNRRGQAATGEAWGAKILEAM